MGRKLPRDRVRAFYLSRTAPEKRIACAAAYWLSASSASREAGKRPAIHAENTLGPCRAGSRNRENCTLDPVSTTDFSMNFHSADVLVAATMNYILPSRLIVQQGAAN